RCVQGSAMHTVGPVGRELQCHDRPHRQPADDYDVTFLTQFFVSGNDAGIPVLPARRSQVVGAAAVPRELRTGYGVTGARQPDGDEPHLNGCAAQAMDEQNAGTAAREVKAAISDAHDSLPSFATFAGSRLD